MGRYDQAPKLVNKKPKLDGNTIMISNEMYSAIFNAVGRKYQAGALMVWLIGQADGFGVALKTVSDALGMDKNGYYKSRAALEELGFITANGDNITIHYNKILGNEKNAPILSNEKDDSKNRVMKKMTHSFDDSILGNEKDDSIFLGHQKDDPMSNEKDDPMSHLKWEYNIEEHIKTYKESQEKLGTENPTSILSTENSAPILNDDFDYVQDAMNSFVKEQQEKKWVF